MADAVQNGMKSETLDEARQRLAALSEAERAGAEQAQEGILAPARDPVLDERAEQINEIGARKMAMHDELAVDYESSAEPEVSYDEEGKPQARRRGSKKRSR
jgi:hypothetical protein